MDSIPADLEFVIDNPDAFSTAYHPLRAVEPGVVMDALETLDGCWGRIEDEVVQGQVETIAEVLRIDVDGGTLTDQIFRGLAAR